MDQEIDLSGLDATDAEMACLQLQLQMLTLQAQTIEFNVKSTRNDVTNQRIKNSALRAEINAMMAEQPQYIAA